MTHAERAARRRQVVALVQNGQAMKDVAARFGVTVAFVRRACQDADVVDVHPNRLLRTDTYQVIARLVNTNDTYTEIAQDMGVTVQWISFVAARCRTAGIKFLVRKSGPKGGGE